MSKDFSVLLVRAAGLVLCALSATLAGCQGMPPPQPGPVQAKQMSANGVTLSYLERGRGSPVVFVHGCCSDGRVWAHELDALAVKHRVPALDQRYYGLAAWADQGERFSGETQIEDLAAFVRGLNAGPVSLVGWSLAATPVLGVAVRYPELVKSVFLYEPAVVTNVTDPADAKAAAEDRGGHARPDGGCGQGGRRRQGYAASHGQRR